MKPKLKTKVKEQHQTLYLDNDASNHMKRDKTKF